MQHPDVVAVADSQGARLSCRVEQWPPVLVEVVHQQRSRSIEFVNRLSLAIKDIQRILPVNGQLRWRFIWR